MTDLSPAAQAVWSSYEAILEYECVVTKTDMKALAAALRATADQVVPLQLPPEIAVDPQRPTVEWHVWNAEQQARFALLAIANELDAH